VVKHRPEGSFPTTVTPSRQFVLKQNPP
jgi:hypothetical protein